MATAAQLGFRTSIGHAPVTGVAVKKFREQINAGAACERKAIFLCVAVGMVLNAAVLGMGAAVDAILAHLRDVSSGRPSVIGLEFAAAICVLMLVIAAATKPDSRAETARQFMNTAAHQQHAAAAFGTAMMMIIALYGSYSLVEAWKRLLMRLRLRHVNLDEAARLLGQIYSAPGGSTLSELLVPGRQPNSLRGAIALLVLDGWIDVVDHGRTVVPRSLAMRSLLHRHPLAEVFQPGELT